MTGPLPDPPVWLALPVGLAFGALLERAGLASARTIADQLAGRDFTVVKVMLSAIVTAMLGVFWATRLGWLDAAAIGMPSTDLVPQLGGAVVFGTGFAFASLCPGTACAAAGTGRRDGLVVVAGLFVGTLAISLAWPALGRLAERSPQEGATLATALSLPTGVLVAAITALAVLALPWLARFEGPDPAVRHPRLATGALLLGALAIPAVRASSPDLERFDAIARDVARRTDRIEPLDLADLIRDRAAGLRLIDVRDGLAGDEYRLPGSEVVPMGSLARLRIGPGERLVLYDDDETVAAQAAVLLRARGADAVQVLRGGLAGWEDAVMAPSPARPDDPDDARRFARARAAAAYFGGRVRRADAAREAAPPRRRNRC